MRLSCGMVIFANFIFSAVTAAAAAKDTNETKQKMQKNSYIFFYWIDNLQIITSTYLNLQKPFKANLFLPPLNWGSGLCITPENITLLETSVTENTHNLSNYSYDIALLVTDGRNHSSCSLDTKAKNAAKLNELYAINNGPRIKYLLDDWKQQNIYTNWTIEEEYFVDEGRRIQNYGVYTIMGLNSHYGEKHHFSHYLRMYMKHLEEFYLSQNRTADMYLNKEAFLLLLDSNRNEYTFDITIGIINTTPSMIKMMIVMGLIFVFVVIILVLQLCVDWRRITIRRNQRGWITGFSIEREHVRPEDMFPVSPLRWKDTLSMIQVEQLPLIKYNVSNFKSTLDEYTLGIIDEEEGDDEDVNQHDEKENEESSSSSQTSSENNNDTVKNVKYNPHPSCTGCSICLEDYVEGEELRLLPKCLHLFHHECIVQWLTFQKNVCPLCSVVVDAIEGRYRFEDESCSMNVVYDDNMSHTF